MEKEKFDVIVLSRNYSTGLGVIRSLGAAGYNVDLISSTKKKGSSALITCSKYVNSAKEIQSKIIQGDTGEDLIMALLQLRKNKEKKAVLFPTDDFTASVALAHKNQLEKYYYMPDVCQDAKWTFQQVMDKSIQKLIADQCGLKTPLQWTISLKDKIEIPKDMIYPCFVKPKESISGRKAEMKKCENLEDLHKHLETMQSFFKDRAVLVQEFLEIEEEYDLSGVCMDQKVVVPGVIKKTKIAAYERGVTMSGQMVSANILTEVKDGLEKFLKAIRYKGMFDMEFNLAGGKIYFNEINLRSGGPSYFYYLCGVNLPALSVEAIMGLTTTKTSPHIKESAIGKTFVYEKVCWEDYIHGYISKKEKDKIINSADYKLIENKEDPKPGQAFNKRIKLSFLKNRLKNLLGKK